MMEPREELDIRGVFRFRLTRHKDPRGVFTEIFRQTWLGAGASTMRQANLSVSHAGVVRGLHYHLRQADYWFVSSGVVRAGLVDLRRASPTRGRSMVVDLDARTPCGLYIPPGVAHGYQAMTDVSLFYLVDAYYDGTDEYGLRWNDPQLGLAWDTALKPLLSQRDRENPFLADIPPGDIPETPV